MKRIIESEKSVTLNGYGRSNKIRRDGKKKASLRSYAVIVTILTSFVMPFMGSALNLSVPDIGSEFGVSASYVGWVITGYMLTAAALNVPFGRWADIYSRKRVLITGTVIMILGCIGAMFAGTMIILIIMRVIQGVGAAMLMSSNIPILISAYPPCMRGKALGIAIGSVYVGGSLGPVIGGVLNHQFGWRSIFVFAGALIFVAFLIAVKLPEDRTRDQERRMDVTGSGMFVIFITLTMLGLSNINEGAAAAATVIFGLAMGMFFVCYEIRRKDPVMDVRLFRDNIGYSMSNVAALLNYAATAAIIYLISIYLQVILGYTSQTAGLIMIIQPAIMAILTPTMGRLSDKYSPFRLSSAGMACCAAGVLLFLFIGEDTNVFYIMTALGVTGIGFALFSSPNTNAILSCVDKRDYSAANAIVSTMRSVGQTSSMVIVTIVVSTVMPGLQLEQADTGHLLHVIRISLVIFMILCVAGIFLSLMRKKN